ncbi:MAG TPA: hypothetical protein DCS93_09655 [Microscillaceae bacterium]|nr:hypothetical protein [Microscillaceae bacterium]
MQPIMRYYLLAIAVFALVHTSGAQFVTTWKTNNPGISKHNQITIPAQGSYTIFWQEVGNSHNHGKAKGRNFTTLTFPKAGLYKISITGRLRQILFSNQGDKEKLMTIEQWGNIAWVSMAGAFWGCKNLTCNAIDAPDLSQVKSLELMFAKCIRFNGIIGHWNTSKVVDMSWMFHDAQLFNRPIGHWNTSQVTNMSYMFYGATSFNQPIGNWNTAKVTNMRWMFFLAKSFSYAISHWNMTKVNDVSNMFKGAARFKSQTGYWKQLKK